MHDIVAAANQIVTTLNSISPGWYIVAVGPLANIAQHFIKKERDWTSGHHGLNVIMSLTLAAVAGGFYAALHTPDGATLQTAFNQFVTNTTLIGTPVWLIATALFYGVSRKLEDNAAAPAAPAIVEPVPTPPGV